MTSKAKRIEQEVARRDVEQLFALAAKAEQRFADRYVARARKLASRNRISLRKYNRLHCKKCATYFSSKTLRVRTRQGSVIYSCLRCGNIARIRK